MSAQPKVEHPPDRWAGDGATVVHQALRREVNESISALNHGFQIAEPELIDVMCECIHMKCTASVSMTVAAYEGLRRFPTHFVVKEGHEVATGERMVSEAAGYVVVEKSGPEGIFAVGADPRRRRHLREAAVSHD
jgi:hypothetical protein